MTDTRTILGIDPGTNLLGFGIVRVDEAGKPGYLDMGVLDLRRVEDIYDKLRIIHEKVCALCELYHPTDLAIESPFYGRNAQVIFKLGRAQGAAMTAALLLATGMADVPIRNHIKASALYVWGFSFLCLLFAVFIGLVPL